MYPPVQSRICTCSLNALRSALRLYPNPPSPYQQPPTLSCAPDQSTILWQFYIQCVLPHVYRGSVQWKQLLGLVSGFREAFDCAIRLKSETKDERPSYGHKNCDNRVLMCRADSVRSTFRFAGAERAPALFVVGEP
eukprot:1196221-Prorocentrum_minimum.AAC.4